MSTPSRVHLIPRDKNLADIARLGLNWKQEILLLTYQDYDRGPLPDHSGEGEVWEFIPEIDGVMVYIKLKLDRKRGLVCLSFHQANGPFKLPYGHARKGDTE